MGYLMYDSSTRIEFDDRVLAHLEVLIVSKLRRKESFALSWREAPEGGDGRTTIWLDVSIPLRFRYVGSRPPGISREWIERLSLAASTGSGLLVMDEDGNPAVGHTQASAV
ncbi:DUF7882 family protein [Leifsonia sp. AG29]|uniref:DUF7882 family protein n=1 Tax=Leifsonia sp. AG29 TaxID=2598860 RepID=UPI00131E475A|nr:ATP-dependent DNA ligase [Leifsonia sp. AG29]